MNQLINQFNKIIISISNKEPFNNHMIFYLIIIRYSFKNLKKYKNKYNKEYKIK